MRFIMSACSFFLDRFHRQTKEIRMLRRNTEIQTALKEIAEAVIATESLGALYVTLHQQVCRVLPA